MRWQTLTLLASIFAITSAIPIRWRRNLNGHGGRVQHQSQSQPHQPSSSYLPPSNTDVAQTQVAQSEVGGGSSAPSGIYSAPEVQQETTQFTGHEQQQFVSTGSEPADLDIYSPPGEVESGSVSSTGSLDTAIFVSTDTVESGGTPSSLYSPPDPFTGSAPVIDEQQVVEEDVGSLLKPDETIILASDSQTGHTTEAEVGGSVQGGTVESEPSQFYSGPVHEGPAITEIGQAEQSVGFGASVSSPSSSGSGSAIPLSDQRIIGTLTDEVNDYNLDEGIPSEPQTSDFSTIQEEVNPSGICPEGQSCLEDDGNIRANYYLYEIPKPEISASPLPPAVTSNDVHYNVVLLRLPALQGPQIQYLPTPQTEQKTVIYVVHDEADEAPEVPSAPAPQEIVYEQPRVIYIPQSQKVQETDEGISDFGSDQVDVGGSDLVVQQDQTPSGYNYNAPGTF